MGTSDCTEIEYLLQPLANDAQPGPRVVKTRAAPDEDWSHPRMSAPLKSSRPPEEFRPVEEWVLDTAGELTTLRASLYRALTGNTLPPGGGLGRVPEKIVLVASELATNALRHGVPPTIVRLLTNGPEFLLDVADHDTSAEPHVPGVRAPGDGGFGLYLAQTLSLDVGWFTDEMTKHVWARFSTTGEDAPTGS